MPVMQPSIGAQTITFWGPRNNNRSSNFLSKLISIGNSLKRVAKSNPGVPRCMHCGGTGWGVIWLSGDRDTFWTSKGVFGGFRLSGALHGFRINRICGRGKYKQKERQEVQKKRPEVRGKKQSEQEGKEVEEEENQYERRKFKKKQERRGKHNRTERKIRE